MSTKRIDGVLFDRMLKNGLGALRAAEQEINVLNVFPVADGDTGTNMCLTLENGLRGAKRGKEFGPYLKSVSEGMLYGARGNSGVILSQLFAGLSQELARASTVGVGDLRNGFFRAYKTAYSAVIRPVEGTILTVAREGIEHIRTQIRRDTTVEQFFTMYVAEMRKSLSYTPELLPELKEAGVVDSGAMGYIAIVDGMLRCLYGEVLDGGAASESAAVSAPREVDLSLFNEDSKFVEGYCMEFILQRMNDRAYDSGFRLPGFVKELETLGNSLVAVENGKRVKVHLHTRAPAQVITLAQRYGEFLTFKLENMQVQTNEHEKLVAKKHEHVPLAVISVVSGSGMRALFAGVGCEEILDGGASMNTPAQEFVAAFRRVDADAIVVLPNDKNITLAARQAVTLSRLDNVTVLPTRSMVEGYFALAMDVPDSKDVDYRIRQMRLGMQNVVTLAAAVAVKTGAWHGMQCSAGDRVVFLDGEPAAVGGSWADGILEAMGRVEDMEDKASCVLFRGREATEEDEEQISRRIGAAYPDLELSFLDGGQSVYAWLLGIV